MLYLQYIFCIAQENKMADSKLRHHRQRERSLVGHTAPVAGYAFGRWETQI